jgi:hypothetical protein
LLRIDEDDRQLGRARTGGHVARVLLVAGRVGDDELALRGAEEAPGHVDGDALLALGRQAVDQQRQIGPRALRAPACRVAFDRLELVVEDQAAFPEQPADQRALAVVHRAAGDEAQQRLALVPLEEILDALLRGVVAVGHQK